MNSGNFVVIFTYVNYSFATVITKFNQQSFGLLGD